MRSHGSWHLDGTGVCPLIIATFQKKNIAPVCTCRTAKLWQSRGRSTLYDEYETYAAPRGSSNNVSLFIHRVFVTSLIDACAEINMVVSYDGVTYAPDLAPRDDFRHQDLHR